MRGIAMHGQFGQLSVPDGAFSQPDQGQDLPPETVASLIEKFYSKTVLSPAEIAKINSLLVQVQARNSSLELPEKLLQSSSSQVRFFAAVLLESLAKKLVPGLSEDKKRLVKSKYIHYVAFAINSEFGVIEFAKLARSCTELYISVREWEDCFRDLVHVLFNDKDGEYQRLSRLSCAGQKLSEVAPVHTSDIGMGQLINNDVNNELQSLVHSISDSQVILLINFMGSFVECLNPNSIDLPEIDKVKVNESFISTCQSMLPMLSALMNKQGLLKSRYSPTAVISLILRHPMFLQSSAPEKVEADVAYLARSIWLQVLQKLTLNADGEVWKSIEEVVETVFTSHTIWVDDGILKDLLAFAVNPEDGLIKRASIPANSQDSVDMQLAARRLCRDIAKKALERRVIESNQKEFFLQLLDYLALSFSLDDEGYEWATQIVDFWTQYAEYVQEHYCSKNANINLNTLQALLSPMSLAMIFIFPRLAIPEDPDDDLAEALNEIQLDVQGLFAQAYTLFNGPISKFHGRNPVPGLIMQTEQDSSLYGIATPELALRMLSGLAETFAQDTAADEVVCLVFNTRLFEPLKDAYELFAPLKSREVDACIELLENYAAMLSRNPQFLPRTIEFLFSILETNSIAHDPEVGRAIKATCLACRFQLIPHFENLIVRYQSLQEEDIYFSEARVDILASFGIVALAVDQASGNMNAITKAIKIVEDEVETFLSIPDPEETTFTQDGLDALQTIYELGKLLRSGSSKETAISLDDAPQQNTMEVPNFQDQAQKLREIVTNLMSTLASSPLLDKNDQAFQTIWDTLRLSERSNPSDFHTAIFDFGPRIFLEVLVLCINRNVTTDYGLETFGMMLSTRYPHTTDEALISIASQAFPICIQYLHKCSRIDDDGDSMSGPLKLLLIYINKCSDIVDKSVDEFPMVVDIVTSAISSANFFTQEAACDVWRTLLRSNKSFVNNVSQAQLQALALSVAQQVSGEALERSIATMAGVLAAMGARGGLCKGVLEDAFRHIEAQGVKVANWARFVQQVFVLRGNLLDTRRVVEQFWRADRLAKAQVVVEEDSE